MMTEIEAIKILKRDLAIQTENKALPDGINAVEMAIKVLERQIELKDCIEKLKSKDFECFKMDINGMIEVLKVFLLDWE